MKFHSRSIMCGFLPNLLLKIQMKSLLSQTISVVLTLTRWEETLGIMPQEKEEHMGIFRRIWEINFKILTCILATPLVISVVHKKRELQWCSWCGDKATISHILLFCPETVSVHKWALHQTSLPDTTANVNWIFGFREYKYNPLI